MKKRKGFTLIELMIVIAIIIILAAIAIPNYLKMTDRARRARVAGDFTSVATAIEAFSVDWGSYPNTPPSTALKGSFGKHATSVIENEITAGTTAVINKTGNTTLTGEDGGIEYIKTGTVNSMYNPFAPNDKNDYFYASSPSGTHWILGVQYNSTDVLYKTDMLTDLKQGTCGDVTGISIDDVGAIGGIT